MSAGISYDNSGQAPVAGLSPGLHLRFRSGGRRILYCYIRKNACSAFKRLIVSRSPQKDRLADFPSRLRFMREHHGVRPADIRPEEYDHIVFVIRDPAERLVSVFRNKFIQRDGNKGIFASYARVTGQAPEEASFETFLDRYMSRPLPELDVHLRPQAAELAPVRYTDAIPLDRLHARMAGIVGQKTADRHFMRKLNSSDAPEPADPATVTAANPSTDTSTGPDARTAPSDVLHRHWRATGHMPPPEIFLTPDVTARIREIYAADYRILAALPAGDGRAGAAE